jgi:hypothetical protein
MEKTKKCVKCGHSGEAMEMHRKQEYELMPLGYRICRAKGRLAGDSLKWCQDKVAGDNTEVCNAKN